MVARLITENDVREGRISDPLVVDRDTIVTPSALDALYAKGIRVVYARDPAASACTASTPAPRGSERNLPKAAARNESSAPTAPTESSASPQTCGCAKGPSETARSPAGTRSPAETRSPDEAPVQRTASGDWVEIYRKGRPRRFDATPFRPARSGAHEPIEAPRGASRREVAVSGFGTGNAGAFVLAMEALGHRILRLSLREAGDRIHLLAAVELGTGEVSLDASIQAIESQVCGFELRCHRSL